MAPGELGTTFSDLVDETLPAEHRSLVATRNQIYWTDERCAAALEQAVRELLDLGLPIEVKALSGLASGRSDLPGRSALMRCANRQGTTAGTLLREAADTIRGCVGRAPHCHHMGARGPAY